MGKIKQVVARLCISCGTAIENPIRRVAYCSASLCRKASRKAAKEKYRSKHPDRVIEQYKKQNKKNWGNVEFRERVKAANKKWCQENKETLKEKNRLYALKHKEHLRTLGMEWRKRQDPERLLEIGRQKYWRNRERILESRRQARKEGRHTKFAILRRGRIRHSPGKTNKFLLRQKLEYYGYKCRYCGIQLDERTVTIDHAIPLSRGGSSWTSNLLPACKKCNSSKRNHTFVEYVRRLKCRNCRS